MEAVNVIKTTDFKDAGFGKLTHIKTDELVQETYYFKPGQVLDYHRHPQGQQIFFVHDGEGTFYLDGGKEETTELKPGVVVLAPKNVWHKVVAKTNLIISQATSQPAGAEKRP